MLSARLAIGLAGALLAMTIPADKAFDYPAAPKDGTVDDYHGTKVSDPYRPLEDPDSAATRAWVEAENKITFGFLEKIPARETIKKRLTTLWDYEKFGVPSKEGAIYSYSRNSGLQNQGVLFTTDTLDGEPRLLIDPNTLTKDGTVALGGARFSQDGKLFAYGLASAGSDWQEWKVRDVASGKDRDDHLKWIKFSTASWTKDGSGFYYGRFPEPAKGADLKGANYFQKLYFHKLGAPQSEDVLVYERPDQKEWQFHGEVTDDGKYLVITVSKGTDDKYRILYKDLAADPKQEPVLLVDNFDDEWTFIDNVGPIFYFKTDRDAPLRARSSRIDVLAKTGSLGDCEGRSSPRPRTRLCRASVARRQPRFVCVLPEGCAYTQVRMVELDGTFVRNVEAAGASARRAASAASGPRTWRRSTPTPAFATPPSIYRYDMATGKSRSCCARLQRSKFDPVGLRHRRRSSTRSKDGTKVPMFITHKKGLKLDASNPTILYGYGGFNISLTPTFSVARIAWLEMGGVYAQANLRGGGEYGQTWHKAGTKLTKQNVFDDFIAAAEYLVAHEDTRRRRSSPSRAAATAGCSSARA